MLSQIKNDLRYMLTTKITINDLNDIVKFIEEAIDDGNGDIIIMIRKGKIFNIKEEKNHYRNENQTEDDAPKNTTS